VSVPDGAVSPVLPARMSRALEEPSHYLMKSGCIKEIRH
jgi:hypothetical protein